MFLLMFIIVDTILCVLIYGIFAIYNILNEDVEKRKHST